MSNAPKDRSRPPLPAEAATLNTVRLADRLAHHMRLFFKRYELTEPQFNVLRILYVANRPLPSNAIAKRLVTRLPDVPRLLDRLEKAGWIERTRSQVDRRVVETQLSAKGEELVGSLDPALAKMHNEAFAHLSAEELETFNQLLERALEWTPQEW